MRLRADRIAVVILSLVIVVSWLPRWRGPIDLRWDASVYYILGSSLARGQGYRLLNEPGEIEASIYPPLLPAIIALHQVVLRTDDPVVVGTWLRGLFFVLFILFAAATYGLLRSVAGPSFALLGTIVCGLTSMGPWLSDRCYTDLPFALALVLFVRRREAIATSHDVWTWLLATVAFLLRTIGVALLIAWIAEATTRRKYRVAMVRAGAALIPVLSWQLYVHHVERSWRHAQPAYAYQRAEYNIYNVSYSDLFSLRDHLNPELGKASTRDRVVRAFQALPLIVSGIGGAISQPRQVWEFAFEFLNRVPLVRHFARWRLITTTMMFLGLIVVAGLVLQLSRREVLLAVSVLIYLAGLCAMPLSYMGELPRYLWVLSPLLMFSAFLAVGSAYRRRHALPRALITVARVLGVGLATFVLALSALAAFLTYSVDLRPVVHRDWNGHYVTYRLFSYSDYHAFDGGLEWLKQHADPNDIVASTTPQWVYLRTGLKSVFPPFDRDRAAAQRLLASVPVRYVVVADWLSRERALPIVKSAPEIWRPVYVDADFAIYERSID